MRIQELTNQKKSRRKLESKSSSLDKFAERGVLKFSSPRPGRVYRKVFFPIEKSNEKSFI